MLSKSLPSAKLLVTESASGQSSHRMSRFVKSDVNSVGMLMCALRMHFKRGLGGKHIFAEGAGPLKRIQVVILLRLSTALLKPAA